MTLHQLRIGLGAVMLSIGCTAAQPPPASAPAAPPASRRDPIPRTRGPACKAVADRMAVVIGEHAPSQTEGDIHEHGMYELRCDSDAWSDDARSCLATITSDAEADGCLRLLSRDQQRALAADRARLRADRVDAHE